MEFKHISVLLDETIEELHIKPDGIYVDGTLGGGGHAYHVCQKLSEKGRYIGIDQDADAIAASTKRLEPFKDKVTIVRDNYVNMPKVLHDLGIEHVDGILLDLGVSSFQLDEKERGFKKELSNFQIAIVVDMWITGFDVPSLAILYNDKPLQRHTLIQTISRVNRKNPGKEYGLIVDYIGIRENMQKALKQFGGDDCIPPDTEITYAAFADELQILKEMLHEFDASDFFLTEPLPRLLALQRAAEFVLAQPPLQKDSGISFSSEFKEHVSRLRSAFSLLQPAGRLNKEESAWAHFFMAVQAINGKTTNSRHSVETMNRFVENMVSEALQCTGVETVLNAEGEEELFSEKFMDEVEKVKLPHTKFQLLVKSLKKAIREYGRTNQLKAQRFDERLLKIIDKYNTRDKLVFANKVASTTISAIQGVVNQKLDELTNEVIELFKRLRKDREEFKRLGITFEEKAFYDILVDQRDVHGFEYADSKCLALAQKIKLLIDNSAVYADWMNNENLRADLQAELTILLYQEGYPPEWDEEVFTKVMEQVRNFKTYNM